MMTPISGSTRWPLVALIPILSLALWVASASTAYAHGGGRVAIGAGKLAWHLLVKASASHHAGAGAAHEIVGHHHGGAYQGGFGFFPTFSFSLGGVAVGGGAGYAYASSGSSPPGDAAPGASGIDTVAYQGRYLGIDEQVVTDANGLGMQVVQVYAGSPAEQAGLQVGDVIYSANGYLTQQLGNLAWIISAVPSGGELQMTVRSARDGALRTSTARLP
jgi:membrane-associated protease RseP (regulator of RpoE activity)